MFQTRNRFYTFVSIGCLFAYALLAWSYNTKSTGPSVCMFKQLTSLPCPSCGSTRAILELAHGNFMHSFLLNPIGIFLACLLVILPLWISKDVLTGSNSFFIRFQQTNQLLKKPSVLLPFLALVAVNWWWNISKGL
ncbi:MAG: DUF2752 domain-containing protein [Bacteroidia bacterium]|nr:DUF2752 domain-containing protein [Bacteroidia bacterium]